MFHLPELGYSYNALEPYIDTKTMETHYSKHHQAYVSGLNAAIEKHPELASKTLDELLLEWETLPEDIKLAIRNHGGGHHNHSLFWRLLKKDSGSKISSELEKMIIRDFGSIEKFTIEFENAAKTRFGSGWAWLVINKDKKLQIISTANQDSPLMNGLYPLIGLDVWEHAYYLKYQNRRPDYISEFWKILDWNIVQEELDKNIAEFL